MRRMLRIFVLLLTVATAALPGCRRTEVCFPHDHGYYETFATQVEYPAVDVEGRADIRETLRPRTVRYTGPPDEWRLSLEEAIRITLANSEVIRDLGGRVLTGTSIAGAVPSVYDPALQETNPNFGPEAALAAFDAQFGMGIVFNRNERTFNNFFFGGGANQFRQNTANFQADITKLAATGTQISFRNVTDFDRNNSPTNVFPSIYDTYFEAEVRQPFLQGAGIRFNRIAGPGSTPGNYNGVVLARIGTDVSLADFEISVRDLLAEVERTYWQLYFAYRSLDAGLAARNEALETWRLVKVRFDLGEADREQEALAREQFFSAQSFVQNALSGPPSGGVTIATSVGVYSAERRLRFLMGLANNDGRLIRPADEPATAEVALDWDPTLSESLWRRTELRKQAFEIERRELELVAARNFLLVDLDFVGKFRRRGFGDDLFGKTGIPNGSAFDDLVTGPLQEWELGVQLSTPIGNRIGFTAVRNAQLQLGRARAVYREQELQISHELAAAFAEVDRAYAVSRSNYNRNLAARERLEQVQIKYIAGEILLEFVLQAQRQAAEAESDYYRSLVDYNLAIANVHLAGGTLLSYYGVSLAEAPWTGPAYFSAAKQARRFYPKHLNYCLTRPHSIALGAYAPAQLPPPSAPRETSPGEMVPAPPEAVDAPESVRRLPEPQS